MRGTVAHFSSAKGWGFIESKQGGPDVFVHFTAIQMDGHRRLERGQEVEYEVEQGEKGIQACNVRPIQ